MTYGFYLAGVAQALERDSQRLIDTLTHMNVCPLGAAAFAGTPFAIDRKRTAELLGFDDYVDNVLDAVASCDFLLESISDMSLLAILWSRVAQDYYVWTTHEFGLIEFPDSVATTSSIMPQKKNPVVLEYLKGCCGHIVAALVVVTMGIKGTHFSHSGESSREGISGFWDTAREVVRSLELFDLVLRTARPVRDQAQRQAARDFSTATALADLMVRDHYLSFRAAHHVVSAGGRAPGNGEARACRSDRCRHGRVRRHRTTRQAVRHRCPGGARLSRFGRERRGAHLDRRPEPFHVARARERRASQARRLARAHRTLARAASGRNRRGGRAMKPLLSIRGLRKHFGPHEVVRGVDLDVHRGEVVAIIGPRGSGKSTFIRCLNCLEVPTEGTVVLGDVTTNAHDHREMAKLREDLGMVFQDYTLFPHMTILRNITFAPVKLGRMAKPHDHGCRLTHEMGFGVSRAKWPIAWCFSIREDRRERAAGGRVRRAARSAHAAVSGERFAVRSGVTG